MPGPTPLFAAGEIVAGRYRVQGLIGQGGMAAVYRARHTGTDKACALKFLLSELAGQPKFRQQFLNEARIAGKIGTHPHIVDVFDTGTDERHGLPFIAMELLEGRTLAAFLKAEGPLARELADAFVQQLARALERAHQAGVVHRDLKPSNIFVIEDDVGQLQLKVLDFGIAKILEMGDGRTATQIGSPWYSAPEQLGTGMRKLAAKRGITIARGVSSATDVWAFGLIACELVGGAGPAEYWGADNLADLMLEVALEQRQPPSRRSDATAALPPGFDEWFLRCTRHNAADRWPSVKEAAAELRRLLAAERESRASSLETTLPLPVSSVGGDVAKTVDLSALAPALRGPKPAEPQAAQPGPEPAKPQPATKGRAGTLSQPAEAAGPKPTSGRAGTLPRPPAGSPPEPRPVEQAASAAPLPPLADSGETARSWQQATAGEPKRSGRPLLIGGAALLVLLIGGGVMLFRSSGEQPELPPVSQPLTSPAGGAGSTGPTSAAAPATPNEEPESEEPAEADDAGTAPSASAAAGTSSQPVPGSSQPPVWQPKPPPPPASTPADTHKPDGKFVPEDF